MRGIAVVYHYCAKYRYPIFRELCSVPDPFFTIISGTKTLTDIKLIDSKWADIDENGHGLRWKQVENFWLPGEKMLWQTGLLPLAWSKEFVGFIFLANPYFISTWIAALLLRLRKRRVFFWTHGVLRREVGIKHFVRKLFLSIPDGIFVYNNRSKVLLERMGLSGAKIHVIYNSVDYEKQIDFRSRVSEAKISHFRRSLFGNDDVPQLLFIGRLTRRKRIDLLIEAVRDLMSTGQTVNLLIVGDGEERNNLERLVKGCYIADSVHFAGACYEEEKNAMYIASSDVCVSPGEVGLTAVHCLGYGTPVITHGNFDEQMPEFEAIIEDKTGSFFRQGDHVDLSRKITHWLSTHPNREMVRRSCYNVIDCYWNPIIQRDVILKAFFSDDYCKEA